MQHGPPGRSDSVPFQPNPTPTSKNAKDGMFAAWERLLVLIQVGPGRSAGLF
jgi:hypothetical protein